MPGEWNKLKTKSEREDWVKKMLKIDETDKHPYLTTYTCYHFTDQLMINFRGFSDADIQKFLVVYPYVIKYNGRFNIPLCEVYIKDLTGKTDAHGMTTTITGDNAKVWDDWCNIEPQTDEMNLQPGGNAGFPGINTYFSIRGTPILAGNWAISMQTYRMFDINNYVVTFNSGESPNYLFINQRYY
jgi:hypothetical protein